MGLFKLLRLSNEWRQVAKIVLLCLSWYTVSAANNVIGKTILIAFPHPMSVTMIQLLSISVYSGPFFRYWGVRKFPQDLPQKFFFKAILPLSFGKFFSSTSAHFSLWMVSVSYSHTVKATMPVFTVFLSWLLLKEKHPTRVYLSLFPIVVGVVMATMTEASFNYGGLASAIIATLGYSLQNIYSKRVLMTTHIHHLRLLQVLGQWALIMFFPLWLYWDWEVILGKDAGWMFQPGKWNIFVLLLTDGLLNWLQNILAFSVLSLITSLSYAVANATKRICVITISLLTLKNPVTFMNVMGMLCAIFGVLFYNKVKYDSMRGARSKPVLPMVENDLLRTRLLDNYTRNMELPLPILQPSSGLSNGYLGGNHIHHSGMDPTGKV